MPDILCFGDSNTHGTPPMPDLEAQERFDRATRWPCVMAAELGPDWHLVEEGNPGRTTVWDDPLTGEYRNGVRVLPSLLESHKPLDVMVMMLGTNDLKAQFSATPQDIALGARRLVDLALASGHVTRILLVSPPPVQERGCMAEMFTGAERRAERLAQHMENVAQSRGVSFLDAGQVIACDPLDGVHFSAASHAKLGRAIAATVKEMTQETCP